MNYTSLTYEILHTVILILVLENLSVRLVYHLVSPLVSLSPWFYTLCQKKKIIINVRYTFNESSISLLPFYNKLGHLVFQIFQIFQIFQQTISICIDQLTNPRAHQTVLGIVR